MSYPQISREWIEALREISEAEHFYPCQTCGKIKAIRSDWDCDRCYRLHMQKRGRAKQSDSTQD